MSSFFDKLNLRPGERRLVIIVMIVVFIILNAIFVWPQFGEWGKLEKRRAAAEKLLATYRGEVGNTDRYRRELSELEKAGATVASEEQALKLQSTIQNQAALSGVQLNRYDTARQTLGPGGRAPATQPNQFFEEQAAVINISGEEKNLVDFLYNLGVGGSLIRVRNMSLTPDQPRHRLQGNITVVASYQKKAPPRAPATATPARTNAPAAASARSTNTPAARNSPFKGTNAPGRPGSTTTSK
jgi:Tfp pilus assembly protein PilO